VYVPEGATVTVALPLQLEHVAGTVVGVTVTAAAEGHVVHVVVRKYNPAIHRLKQSPPVFMLKFDVVAPVATAVFVCMKFHQFHDGGIAVPLALHDVGLN
jgi:hypothetical protein